MFQGPKGYIAQICEVYLQYGNSTTQWPITLFLVNSTLIYILFSLMLSDLLLLVRGISCLINNGTRSMIADLSILNKYVYFNLTDWRGDFGAPLPVVFLF